MSPRAYDFKLGADTFAPDCNISWRSRSWNDWRAPRLSASFGEKNFYVDPVTPSLQQTVATVTFSQPVSREEIVRRLTIVNMSGTPLFAPGGKPQVIADEKKPAALFPPLPAHQARRKGRPHPLSNRARYPHHIRRRSDE